MTSDTSDVTEGRPGTDGLTESDRHRLLATERRRAALDTLEGRTAPVDLADLAAGLVGRERGADGFDEETLRRVAVRLHHVDLPMMADLGVVDYDPDANRVERCPGRPGSADR